MKHTLDDATARKFAQIALGHVAKEYPNQPMHAMAGDEDTLTPRALHPAFFGSFDWHSCVHSWWLLLTLRRLFPSIPEAQEITALAETTFTEEKLAVELAYLQRPTSRGWERPYGWAWLLYLQLEASRHDDQVWDKRLEPMARFLAERLDQYLHILTYPITVGTHFNTAFALVLAGEWSRENDPDLLSRIESWAVEAFGHKQNYSGWEPGGDEFLSPVLTAALLVAEITPSEQFSPWFDALVLSNGWLERECKPVTVSDRSDGKIAHLDGLNLSRAWCLIRIGRKLSEEGAKQLLAARAKTHLSASLPHIAGDYMGEHWLASFALLALIESR
ncbi:DUF2891 domain-containing protein [Erythrobacter sp. SCSIO 43205]|uniref:DUF2891 domain-containing protein n=1 Tax=Erythrobacter sp. SCSIO 43205 TaxID=2779361 RepID=UPI001CA94F12|nr:DUF2891 domain-containing protein [Erythrobacter sp. SCSIO 43205]UAB76858.1 DUF2891 domain-containing protein [Erythrobacter sp. SCSIO 43205]